MITPTPVQPTQPVQNFTPVSKPVQSTQTQPAGQPDIKSFIKQARQKGVSDDQIYNYLKSKNAIPSSSLPQPTKDSGFISSIGSDLAARGEQLKQTFNDTRDKKINAFESGFQSAGALAGGVGDIIGEAAKPVISAVGNAIPQPIKEGVSSFIQDKAAKEATKGKINPVEAYQSWAQSNPRAAKDLESVVNIASLFPAEKVGEAAVDVGKGVVEGVGKAASEVAPSQIDKSLIESAKNDWVKPTTINKSAYSKATDIYRAAEEKGHDIGETLLNNKVNLADNVQNGAYDTVDTANKMRSDAGKLSNQLLRPSLEKADKLVEKTPVEEIINEARTNVESSRSLTQEEKDTVLQKLDKSEEALKRQYKDGMSLTDIHDEKILRGQKSGFSPVGDIETNVEAQKNNSLRDALKTKLEQKAPKDIPVEEFNNELHKQYRTADYLEALHGKKVPQGMLSKIAKTTSKVAGAVIGSHGGILGAAGGYHLGGMLESVVEKLPLQAKANLIRNLEVTNPAAFEQLQKYLGK